MFLPGFHVSAVWSNRDLRLITEKCECFSLDLAEMLLLQRRIQMFSLLDLLALCSNSVAWSRLARAAQMLLVRTDKRSVKHIMSSAVSFRFHYACHLMLRNVVVAAPARILSAGKMVQVIVRFVCVPNRKPRTETVQYEYMYRYTPSSYVALRAGLNRFLNVHLWVCPGVWWWETANSPHPIMFSLES